MIDFIDSQVTACQSGEMSPDPNGENANPERCRWTKGIRVGISMLILLGASGIAVHESTLPREQIWMMGIFAIAALFWMTEWVPLFVTALLVMGLEMLLLCNPTGWPGLGFESGQNPLPGEILHVAADPILLLFLGGFILAQATSKERVDQILSTLFLKPFGKRPDRILLGIILITAFFSMWMSNTATTAMMLALMGPMLRSLSRHDPFRKALVLSVPFGANVGGLGTPIASPPNAIAVSYLAKVGHPLPFIQWMLIAVPVEILMLLILWKLLLKCYPPQAHVIDVCSSGTLNRKGRWVVGIFLITVLMWMTDALHGIPSYAVALFPVIALTLSGILTKDDVNRLDWDILILIAGGITLGGGIHLTGLDQTFAQRVTGIGITEEWPLVMLLIACTILLSTFMSNTAATNLILPLGMTMVTSSKASPEWAIPIGMGIAFAASMSMSLPISTPPNAMAYGKGEFQTRDMIRTGSAMTGIGLILILVLMVILRGFHVN